MKYLMIFVLGAGLLTDPLQIGKINRAKRTLREAYSSGDYKTVIKTSRYLIDSLQVSDDEVVLNLANAYYLTNDTAQAYQQYQSLTGSMKGEVKSKAQQQLGIMNYKRGKMDEALMHFKQAVKADSKNSSARYNYEMLKRKLDEKKKEDEKNQLPKEPSAFAKQLKAKAEALAAQGKFQEAYDLMTEGVKKDKSVLYYVDFITRLKEVADINKNSR
jgi:tetratricopeptide (TPR) repeat protein